MVISNDPTAGARARLLCYCAATQANNLKSQKFRQYTYLQVFCKLQ